MLPFSFYHFCFVFLYFVVIILCCYYVLFSLVHCIDFIYVVVMN
jgi:hypothetical protein